MLALSTAQGGPNHLMTLALVSHSQLGYYAPTSVYYPFLIDHVYASQNKPNIVSTPEHENESFMFV